ncbi:conserved hypothetical protein [Candidatus Sulfopaludibacter sp. SbA4]|nr:conserved hypothetical protein [Candidatus Sulfopaludibacter sp. SbA4]
MSTIVLHLSATLASVLSIEEYLTLPVPENRVGYEYDDGKVIEVPAHNLENAKIQSKVIRLFGSFLDTARLDIDVLCPTGYWLSPNVERVPDVSLLSAAKAAAMEVFHGSLRGAPDAAIEIVSPNESATELERKVDQYLAAGVLAVILVYPETRHVLVYRPNGEARRLGTGDALELPDLLPGMKLPIDEWFTT